MYVVISNYFNLQAGQWMKINVTFTDHEMKSLPAVAVQNSLVKLFSSVSQKVSQFHQTFLNYRLLFL